jgi:very-short-patch-repair endonuclease
MKGRKLRNDSWRKLPEAGQELEKILLSLNKGVLRGKFKTKWYASGRLFDFFFPEIRLAILLDGNKEKSAYSRLQKVILENFCEDEWITLLYIKEEEIEFDKDKLIEKLRAGYRAAKKLINSKKQ